MQTPENVDSSTKTHSPPGHKRGWLIAAMSIAIACLLCLILWHGLSTRSPKEAATPSENAETASDLVDLPKDGPVIQLVTTSRRPPISTFSVTGTVEPNPKQVQQITPLVSGRVKNIYVSLGDYVTPGKLLVRMDSPQVAELHGKLHEAETRVKLATINLNRVQQSANRVSVLKAKATLAEAESTLKRTKQLVSEGLTAGKDLIAAESNYERAKADYNFQKDISLNREVSEARAELKTAKTEAEHVQDGLKALDAYLPSEGEGSEHDISSIELRSPMAGTVIERLVNPGTGFEQGKPLLTIANTKTLWVIANVPEKQMPRVHIGTPAKVYLGPNAVSARVSYVDPRLNEDTRTSRVRIEIDNSDQRIQVGSFAQIEFSEPVSSEAALYVPEAAIQTLNGKSVIFVHDASSGKYHVRKVETGTATAGLVPIFSGLSDGEQIAADGSFILKSKVLREQFEDND